MDVKFDHCGSEWQHMPVNIFIHVQLIYHGNNAFLHS